MTVEPNESAIDSLLSWLERDAHRLAVEQPPAELTARLIDLFDASTSEVPGADIAPDGALELDTEDIELLFASALEEIVAELIFDSRRDVALSGSRGISSGIGYHLAFTAAGADVVVNVRRHRDSLGFSGQVFTHGIQADRSIIAEVICPGHPSRSAVGDHHGRFEFTDLPTAALGLRIVGEGLRLRVDLPADLAP